MCKTRQSVGKGKTLTYPLVRKGFAHLVYMFNICSILLFGDGGRIATNRMWSTEDKLWESVFSYHVYSGSETQLSGLEVSAYTC